MKLTFADRVGPRTANWAEGVFGRKKIEKLTTPITEGAGRLRKLHEPEVGAGHDKGHDRRLDQGPNV